MKPIIELKNLTVVYDKGQVNETVGVRDVNLEIFPGEYIIFYGPSGCGKSTLLYTIAGLEFPTVGDVLIDGQNLKNKTSKELIDFYRQTIGMVFQAYYLLPHLNARDNILLPQLFAGISIAARNERVKLLIERFGIESYADRKPSRMSGGQQQRTAIARSLVNEPLVVLADEPVGNLDSKNAEIVLEMLLDINVKEKKTIIYVTHNPRDLHYAHRVFYLKDGVVERVTRNAERGRVDGRTEEKTSELARLAGLFPYVSETRLQSKLILNNILGSYDFKVMDFFERIVEKYILKSISVTELTKALHSSVGGLGLYQNRAAELAERIAALTSEIATVREDRQDGDAKKDDALAVIRHHLLDTYAGGLTVEQLRRLNTALEERVSLRMSSAAFDACLDRPISEGGVGLNRRTASKFTEETELLLMEE